jgi:type I restriction enzyme S subunit
MIWKKVAIGEFLEERKDRFKPEMANSMNLKRINKIDFSGNIHLEKNKPTKTGMILVKSGDLVISGINADKGAVSIYSGKEDVMATIHYSSYSYDSKKINIDYLKWFLKSKTFLNILKEQTKGGIKTELKAKKILPLVIEIPDLEDQKTILDKINSINQECKELSDLQTETIANITNLKQAILQEAIQGKLTQAWRTRHPELVEGQHSAEHLLQRIKTEKAQLIKEGKIKKEKPLPKITKEEIPFEIPKGWVWCKLGDLCSKTGSGSTPRGGQSAYVESGIKFLRSQNVYDDGLRLNGVAFIPQITHTKMKGTYVQAEDLLLNITGGSIGRCCIVPKDFDTGNINQHVAIIRTVDTQLGYYLHNIILSSYFQKEIINVQTGAGREGLPKNKMDTMLIPIPPLEEQKEIVKKVATLMQKCTALEAEITQSETNAQMLMQAVLKEAFEG